MPTPRTAQEYAEMLEFAEQVQQTKQAVLNPMPALRAAGSFLKSKNFFVPKMLGTAAHTTKTTGPFNPLSGVSPVIRTAVPATGLFKAVPAAAKAVTAIPRWVWKNPTGPLTAGILIPPVLQAAENSKGYADGVSTGVAQGLHGLANAPFSARASMLFAPQSAYASDSAAQGVYNTIQGQMAKEPFWKRWLTGDAIATNTLLKMKTLQQGGSLDSLPNARALAELTSNQRVQELQDLYQQINARQGINAAPPG